MSTYWKKHARRYDRFTLFLNRRFSEMALAAAWEVSDSDEVLEIAAGTGLVTEVVAPGARRYIATDATPEMLDLLTHRVAEVPGVEVRRADALSLDFDAASFDVVLIANLVHLLDDPGSAIREAGRVLRPGGKLVIPTFAHGQGLLARFLSRLLGLSGFPVVTRFRDEQLDALVANNGFEILSARWFRGFLPIRFVVGRVLPQQLVDR